MPDAYWDFGIWLWRAKRVQSGQNNSFKRARESTISLGVFKPMRTDFVTEQSWLTGRGNICTWTGNWQEVGDPQVLVTRRYINTVKRVPREDEPIIPKNARWASHDYENTVPSRETLGQDGCLVSKTRDQSVLTYVLSYRDTLGVMFSFDLHPQKQGPTTVLLLHPSVYPRSTLNGFISLSIALALGLTA